MNTRQIPQFDPNATGQKRQGWGSVLLFLISAVWVIAFSAIDLFVTWSLEQTLFEDVYAVYDQRWLFQAVYAVLLFVPLILLSSLAKAPRLKIIYRLWLIGTLFSAICIPLKTIFLTAQQETAIFQIGILAIGLFVYKVFQRRAKPARQVTTERKENYGIAALLAGILALPWVLFGALGSWEDTILFLLAGVMFGLFVSQIVYPYLLEITQHRDRDVKVSDFLLDGFVIAVFLLILVAGLSVNGSQIVLVIVVPASGFLISALSIGARGTVGKGKWSVAVVTAVAFCMPLIWFDMDELFLLISSTPGETLDWATQAAWLNLTATAVIAVIAMINFSPFKELELPKWLNAALGGVVVAGLLFAYFAYGQVGWFGDRFFVILDQQADLSSVSTGTDIAARRAQVYTAAVTVADQNQANLRSGLTARGIQFTPYYLVNSIEVNGGIYARLWVQSQPEVNRILEAPILRPLHAPLAVTTGNLTAPPASPTWNVSLIGADRAQTDFGATGKGIVIGQSDSGVDGTHVQLAGTYRGANGSNDYNWLDPWNHTTSPTDIAGHGTATLALIVGKDFGIAPDAQWYACVNLARNLGNPGYYLNCMQFMLAPYPQNGNPFTDGDPSRGAMVLNNSWGCPTVEGCDANVFLPAVTALDAAGIFVTSAAGNNGYFGCGSVTDPLAIYAGVFTAGSINQSGALSTFSSLGPVLVDASSRVKPDIAAPGEGVTSAFPKNTYQTVDGTSFAGPHVAGVVALMWSANQALIGQTAATRQILDQTASPMTQSIPQCSTTSALPNNAVGYGILNAYDAVREAIAYK